MSGTIEVVGTGCANCQRLYEITQQIAAELKPEPSVQYVTNQAGMKRLLELGLMQSPALVVGGQVVMTGFRPDVQKIKSVITTAIHEQPRS